jgi:hypothetical protein
MGFKKEIEALKNLGSLGNETQYKNNNNSYCNVYYNSDNRVMGN